MRLIKAQSTNLRNIKGTGLKYDIHGINRMGGETGVVVPLGNTSKDPYLQNLVLLDIIQTLMLLKCIVMVPWGEIRKKNLQTLYSRI